MHHSTKFDNTRELVLFTEKNQRALVNLVPEAFAQRLRQVWAKPDNPLALNERQLTHAFGRAGRSLAPLDRELRCRFYTEYDRLMAKTRPEPMDMPYVIARSISKEQFYKYYIQDDLNLAHLVLPPVDYVAALKFNLDLAMLKVNAILELPVINKKTGEPDLKVIEKIMRTYESLHNKHMGIKVKVHEEKKGYFPSGEGAGGPGGETAEAKLDRLRTEHARLKAEREQQLKDETAKPVEGTV